MFPEHIERLSSIVARRLGLAFDESRCAELADAFARRLAERGRIAPDAWLDTLEVDREELRSFAQMLTVGETYFFRAPGQLDVLRDVLLGARPRSRGPELRILSAGCSSGEEPYSIAIVLREWERQGLPASWLRWHVHGVDLSTAALAKAEAGVYSEWSLRETSPALRERWFTARGRLFEVRRALRDGVTFEQRSLFGEVTRLAPPESFDVVFCRNVIMYLTPEAARSVVAQLRDVLVPGGCLFLGHAESLRGLTDELALESSHGTFYYRRPERRSPRACASLPRASASPRGGETVRRPAPVPPAPVVAPPATLDDVRRLVAVERFESALEVLAKLAPEGVDVGADVLRAVAHLGVGNADAAERACMNLLASPDPPVEAHLVLALLAEHRGDCDKAVEHHRAAVYLAPDLALAHLHLGRIQRRAGQLAEARHELGQALELLQREPSSRLLLLGGGFGREGLLALCRTELACLGGTS